MKRQTDAAYGYIIITIIIIIIIVAKIKVALSHKNVQGHCTQVVVCVSEIVGTPLDYTA